MSELPVDEVLPHLLGVMRRDGAAVLQAPPGAGKTTRVPLHFLQHNLCPGRIVMLEPRRVAARAAAERLAEQLGEPVGQTVGYRIRGETKVSDTTRIEVVTEGILTRMLQSDPELSGIDCLIFDEFHERSLQADLGLALSLEVRTALRPDLKILVMSATLDAGAVAELLGGVETVTSQGRAFEVAPRWLARPWSDPSGRPRFEDAAARLVLQALEEETGGVLVFLPGAGEIRRVQERLARAIGPEVDLQPLYGALPFATQRRALVPLDAGRKLVLATSIAETSLTIPDIRVVVDCGRARRPAFDPASGMTRLVTTRVTRAEARQREGRAGRVQAGVCYKLWTKGEEGGLQAYPPAEIEAADLTGFALELALWGVPDVGALALLTPPPQAAMGHAREVLTALQVLDRQGRLTEHGRALAGLPVHPRLAHMLSLAGGGEIAALVAAMLELGDPLRGQAHSVDLEDRLEFARAMQRSGRKTGQDAAPRQLLADAQRLRKAFTGKPGVSMSVGGLLSLAYPDRIAMRREGAADRYLLAGGAGAHLPQGDRLQGADFLVAADLDGDRRDAAIRLAAVITKAEILDLHEASVEEVHVCRFDKPQRRVLAQVQRRLGALVLDFRPWAEVPQERLAAALAEGIRSEGLHVLPWTRAARYFRARVGFLRQGGVDLPDMSEPALAATLEDWLVPYLGGLTRLDQLERIDLADALRTRLDWTQQQEVDRLAPASFTAPTGTRCPIDYEMGQPRIQVRLQEMFGIKEHPTVGRDRTPLLVELLSPARRPVQATADLPGFWASSYVDVRKEMRGRYPKHPWPEDPSEALPTTRAKPRK